MKLTIKRATILKVNTNGITMYYVFDDGDLVAKFYNKEDARDFADHLNRMHTAR